MKRNEEFRIEFQLEQDPDQGQAIDPEEAASWGWFQIHSGNSNLCWHVNGTETSDRVHWYLLPLLEWLVENWNSLLHEVKIPQARARGRWRLSSEVDREPSSARDRYCAIDILELSENDQEEVELWWRRHALRAGASGGVFPDLFIRREGDSIELSWGNVRHGGLPANFRFLAAAGRVLHSPREFADSLYQAIGKVAREIANRSPGNRVEQLLSRHEQLKSEDKSERLAWIFGIQTLGRTLIESFKNVVQSVPAHPSWFQAGPNPLVVERAPVAVAMFGSVAPTISKADIQQLLGIIEKAEVAPPVEDPVESFDISFRDEVDGRPWDQGYEFALKVRERLQAPDQDYVDIDGILQKLRVRVTEVTLEDRDLRAVALCGPGLSPTIAINGSCNSNKGQPGRRFTLAHELCHLLFDRTKGVPLAVATGPWAPRDLEKRANAFAAMFLMPEDRVSRWLQDRPGYGLSDNDIGDLASSFVVGREAAAWHLQNLGLLEPL